MLFDTGELLMSTFGLSRALIVGLWPLMLVQPLRRGRWVRVGDFVLAWSIVAVFWFGGLFLPEDQVYRFFTFIPPALDLPLFLAVGAGICVWFLLSRRRARAHRSDASRARSVNPGTSPIEALFWERARPRIPDLQWLYPIGRYRADFFVPSANLVIELNGLAYHSGREKRIRDAVREREIERRGYRVITFLGPEVTRDPDRCVAEVLAVLASEPSTPMAPVARAAAGPDAPVRLLGLTGRQLLVLGGLGTLVALAVVVLAVTVAYVVVGGAWS